MRDFLKAFLLSVFYVFTFVNSGFSGVGSTDNREYVTDSMWATDPYNKFVYMYVMFGSSMEKTFDCTAQYIAPNLILSAAHCAKDGGMHFITSYKKEYCFVELLEKGGGSSSETGDWAIFLVENKDCYSDSYFDVVEPKQTVEVLNAGYGWMRKLEDWELDKIRQILDEMPNVPNDKFYDELEERVLAANMKPLRENPKKLKYSSCVLVFDDCKTISQYSSVCKKTWKSDFYPNVLATSCDAWAGNSGGAVVSKTGSHSLYGVLSYTINQQDQFSEGEDAGTYVSQSKQFLKRVEYLKSMYPAESSDLTSYSPEAKTDFISSAPGITQQDSNRLLGMLPTLEPETSQDPKDVQTDTQESSAVSAPEEQPNITNNNKKTREKKEKQPKQERQKVTRKQDKTETNTTSTLATANGSASILGGIFSGVTGFDSGGGGIAEIMGATNQTATSKKNINVANSDKNSGIVSGVSDLVSNKGVKQNTLTQNQYDKTVREQEKKVKASDEKLSKEKNTKAKNRKDVLRKVQVAIDYKVESDNLEILKKAYEDAKSKEQSFANRALTAASVAAMGIGGMELARGLAEQKADKEAEQSMDAYIATMRCKYGSNSVKVGTGEIELPGGNNANMMKLRNEYFSLATDLKERKTALGMTPGIESETIMDKSEMGLYEDENVGITGGAYSSLYRAKVMASEKDQTQIDEEKSNTNKRVVGGGAAVVAGGAGGMIGNAGINKK